MVLVYLKTIVVCHRGGHTMQLSKSGKWDGKV